MVLSLLSVFLCSYIVVNCLNNHECIFTEDPPRLVTRAHWKSQDPEISILLETSKNVEKV